MDSLRRASQSLLSPLSSPKESDSPNAQGKAGSMFSSLRRASMSLGFRTEGGSVGLPRVDTVDKRRSIRNSTRPKGSPKRSSVKSRAEPVLLQPHVEHASLVLQQALYRRGDPFKNLSSTWLAGGEKGELPEESSDEELLEQSRNKRKKGKAEVSETEMADFITGLRRNMKKPETQAVACEELSQRLAGRKQEGIDSIVIEEAATTALEAAQEHPDDMQLHMTVCPLLADLLTFSKASGGYPTSIIASGAALALQSYLHFYEKLDGDDQFEKVFKRLAKELPVEDQLHIMHAVGDALPAFCANMHKKAAHKKFQQEEVVRRHQLKNSAFGHLTWLRGHKIRADLMPTWQVTKKQIEEKQRTFVDKGPPRVGGDVWYKVWVPNSQKAWCYKGNFVNEARFLAESQKMDFAWLSVETAQKLFERDPTIEEALQYHVVAVATDDKRYFWSHAFVQFLTVLQEESDFPYGQVCYTVKDFQRRYPQAKFPVPGKYTVVAKSEAVTLPVPPAISRNLRSTPTLLGHSTLSRDQEVPAPPPLPDRLPCPIPYELTEPWMCIFASDMEKQDMNKKLLELQRNAQAERVQRIQRRSFSAAEDVDEESEAAEQPEEEEVEEDEEVDPHEMERQRLGRKRSTDEREDLQDDLQEDPSNEGGAKEDQGQQEDQEIEEGPGELGEEDLEAEEQKPEISAEELPRSEGSGDESEFGEQESPSRDQVRKASTMHSQEDGEPEARRASRRQSKD
ncbi:unnamed protein product [Durusdinium trenchii]|uniref:Uncharacterized protein n=2 Tax=Durusdinium trenchii TaxID=1381693 RepID=A0ABP0H7F1_9DINO